MTLAQSRIDALREVRQCEFELREAAENAPLEGLAERILELRQKLEEARAYALSLNPLSGT